MGSRGPRGTHSGPLNTTVATSSRAEGDAVRKIDLRSKGLKGTGVARQDAGVAGAQRARLVPDGHRTDDSGVGLQTCRRRNGRTDV